MSGFLHNLLQQHENYVAQRKQAEINFQQLCGAIHVLEQLINEVKARAEEEKAKSQGVCENVEVKCQDAQ